MCVSLDHHPLFHFNLAIALILNLLLYPVPKSHLYLMLNLRYHKLF